MGIGTITGDSEKAVMARWACYLISVLVQDSQKCVNQFKGKCVEPRCFQSLGFDVWEWFWHELLEISHITMTSTTVWRGCSLERSTPN